MKRLSHSELCVLQKWNPPNFQVTEVSGGLTILSNTIEAVNFYDPLVPDDACIPLVSIRLKTLTSQLKYFNQF